MSKTKNLLKLAKVLGSVPESTHGATEAVKAAVGKLRFVRVKGRIIPMRYK